MGEIKEVVETGAADLGGLFPGRAQEFGGNYN